MVEGLALIKAKVVKRPGSRGGKWHLTSTGKVSYDDFANKLFPIPDITKLKPGEIRKYTQMQGSNQMLRTGLDELAAKKAKKPGAYYLVGQHFTKDGALAFRAVHKDDIKAHLLAAAEADTDVRGVYDEDGKLHDLDSLFGKRAAKRLSKEPTIDELETEAKKFLDARERRATGTVAARQKVSEADLRSGPTKKPRTKRPIAKSAEVKNPGVRGGKYWIDKNGKVRYGKPPKGTVQAIGKLKVPGGKPLFGANNFAHNLWKQGRHNKHLSRQDADHFLSLAADDKLTHTNGKRAEGTLTDLDGNTHGYWEFRRVIGGKGVLMVDDSIFRKRQLKDLFDRLTGHVLNKSERSNPLDDLALPERGNAPANLAAIAARFAPEG